METTEINTPADTAEERAGVPPKGMKYMVDFVTKMYTGLGASMYHSKDDIASINDLKANSIKGILSLGQTLNLLELKHGTGYKVTGHFLKIHKPLSDAEKKHAIVESMRMVPVFAKLLTDYAGHTLPLTSSIINNVARSFGMTEANAKRVTEMFIEAINDFDLLNNHREMDLSFSVKKVDAPTPPNGSETNRDNMNEDTITIPIFLSLSKNKRIAEVIVPNDFNDTDLDRIISILTAYKSVQKSDG
jgi:hypothetical protein